MSQGECRTTPARTARARGEWFAGSGGCRATLSPVVGCALPTLDTPGVHRHPRGHRPPPTLDPDPCVVLSRGRAGREPGGVGACAPCVCSHDDGMA